MLHAHSQPAPELNDPRRRTQSGDDAVRRPEGGVDDPDQGRPGPSRGPRPHDDVSEQPDRGDPPEHLAPRRLH